MGSLTIMNMLVGVVVDVVSKVGDDEREKHETRTLDKQIGTMVATLDKDGTGCVSREEFDHVMLKPDTLKELKKLEIDLVSFVNFTRNSFPENGELTVKDFEQILLIFTGAKPATVKDVAESRQDISLEIA